ncbi:hypothetical protein OF83DRAFT_1082759 [Amylostereum chailletii]|nr:hypothetical protein OF83DRAFT_1082759 [Amylostereum chailletii]
MSSQLVWLITGTSSGLGRELALEALGRGDKVIATSRAPSSHKLGSLKAAGAQTLVLDVTAPLEELHAVAKVAVSLGNLFGPLNVARAFLPYMRAARRGTILWNGSCKAWVPLVNVGLYAATKAAVHSLSSTLHAEISPFGLRSIVVEAGHFRTSVVTVGHRPEPSTQILDYRATMDPVQQAFNGKSLSLVWSSLTTAIVADFDGHQPGDPKKGVKIFVDLVRGEGVAAGRSVPQALPLGSDGVKDVRSACEEALRVLDDWNEVCVSTDFKSRATSCKL